MALNLAVDTVGSGPPLLVLHGLFGSASNWRSVARELAATHTVHSVDLRNHGASPWAETMDYMEMADDLRQLIDRLGLQRAAVMGHSMGGKVAMSLALRHPDRVERLIVVDIAPLSYADTLSPFAQAMRGVDLLAASSRAEVQSALLRAVPDAAVVPFLMQNLVTRQEHFDWRINLVGIAAALPALCAFPSSLLGASSNCPTTVIAGRHSDFVPGHDPGLFRPLFTDVALEVIDDAGHWVHADQPDAFVRCVQRALQAPAATAAPH